jgi:KDO2-lipid IV(A) lauroyltransferase
MIQRKLSFIFILILTWPIRWLSYPTIHRLGTFLGTCAYYALPKFRKKALSNLALASFPEIEIQKLAKASLQNLMITCLEYAKFSSETKIGRVASCVNPDAAAELMKNNKPVIFFCGHQSNWEVLFLEGTSRMPGVAIGRPIKNAILYEWITSIRQKYGGKMITPQNAIREGLRGLKRGAFLGIVGDQGMPDSGYSSLFFGKKAWTSPIAAILSYRTGSPIMVATTRRKEGKYFIHYSDAIWPDATQPMEQEVDRLMKAALAHLELTIKEDPGQWLWAHNRWKQQTPDKLKRKFRYESILIILPREPIELKAFREIYPHEFITVYAPQGFVPDIDAEVAHYANEEQLLNKDYRFKLVFNFSSSPKVKSHYKKLAAFEVVTLQELRKIAKTDETTPFADTLTKALLKNAP